MNYLSINYLRPLILFEDGKRVNHEKRIITKSELVGEFYY